MYKCTVNSLPMRPQGENRLKCLEAIKAFNARHGRTPSFEELRGVMKFRSRGAVQYYVQALIEDGWLEANPSGRIKLTGITSTKIPFIGVVHAGKTVGFPNPSEEETSETMTLEELLTVDLDSAKLFRVRGDSMIDAGIFQDDVLLVECSDKWNSGDIVIAEIDGEETVKYIFKDGKNGKPFLRAANDNVPDMHPSEYMKVKATVRACIKHYARRA